MQQMHIVQTSAAHETPHNMVISFDFDTQYAFRVIEIPKTNNNSSRCANNIQNTDRKIFNAFFYEELIYRAN